MAYAALTGPGAWWPATWTNTRRGEKVKIFKKIRRQGYRRTKGHRQTETVLRVTAIAGADGKEIKWDGKVDLTTKGELNARARGLTYLSPAAQAEAAAAAKVQTPKVTAAAKPAKVAKPAAKAAPAPDAAEAKAAPAKNAAPAKAEAPKAKAAEKNAPAPDNAAAAP